MPYTSHAARSEEALRHTIDDQVAGFYVPSQIAAVATDQTAYMDVIEVALPAGEGQYMAIISGFWSYDDGSTNMTSRLMIRDSLGNLTQVGSDYDQSASGTGGVGVQIGELNSGTNVKHALQIRSLIDVPVDSGWTFVYQFKSGRLNKVASMFDVVMTVELKVPTV